jgi:hypothetical protein
VVRCTAVALVVALVVSGAASAKRAPTKAEAAALHSAFVGYVNMPHSPAAKDDRVVSSWISTRDSRYAALKLDSKSAGPSELVLHKSLGSWWVEGFGSSLPCDSAPAPVLADLGIGCSPPNGVAWINNCGPLASAPKEIVLTCADANSYLTNLAWHGWGSSSTSTTGVAHQNDCKPYCAAGHFHTYPAKVTASKLTVCGSARYYARLEVVYTAARPTGVGKTDVQTLGC